MRLVSSFGAVLLLSSFVACASDSEQPPPSQAVIPHVFVGHVAGSRALVAIVESEESVVAYTCGIGDDRLTHTGWYYGVKQPVLGDNVQLVNGPAGLRIRASLSTVGGSGVLTLADASTLRQWRSWRNPHPDCAGSRHSCR